MEADRSLSDGALEDLIIGPDQIADTDKIKKLQWGWRH